MLYNLIVKIVPHVTGKNRELERYNYLKHKYDELNWRNSKTRIKNRYGYLKKIIEAEVE